MRPGASLVRNWVKWFEMLFYVFFFAVCWLLVLVCLFLLLVFLLLHRFTWFGVLDGSCLIHPVTGSLVKLPNKTQINVRFFGASTTATKVTKPTPQPFNGRIPPGCTAWKPRGNSCVTCTASRLNPPGRHASTSPRWIWTVRKSWWSRVAWPCFLSTSRLKRGPREGSEIPKANLNHRLDGI